MLTLSKPFEKALFEEFELLMIVVNWMGCGGTVVGNGDLRIFATHMYSRTFLLNTHLKTLFEELELIKTIGVNWRGVGLSIAGNGGLVIFPTHMLHKLHDRY